MCASGLKAMSLAAGELSLGRRSVMVAGGMESLSNTPFTLGIAFPSKYGQFRVTGGTEITRNKADGVLSS